MRGGGGGTNNTVSIPAVTADLYIFEPYTLNKDSTLTAKQMLNKDFAGFVLYFFHYTPI